MNLETNLIESEMNKVFENYQFNLHKILVGKINYKIFDDIKVKYYDELQNIVDLCLFTSPEPRQILIKPYDKNIVKDIVSAISCSHLKLNPINEGEQIRIKIPELSSERRKELVKLLNKYTEESKIVIRNIRQKNNKKINAIEPISKNEKQNMLDQIQKITDKFIKKIDDLEFKKSNEIMTI